MVGFPRNYSDGREPPVSAGLSRDGRPLQGSVAHNRTSGRPSTEDRGPRSQRSTNPLPPESSAPGPQPATYVVDGGMYLPEGQFLITVAEDGVTLAWRGDENHSTIWMPPVDAVMSE